MKLPHPGRQPTLAGLLLALVLGACASPDATPSSSGRTATPPPTADATDPAAREPGPTVEPSDEPAPSTRTIADDPGAIALEPVIAGLDAPIGFATAPGGWLVVHERDGRAVAVDVASGEERLVLDIGDRVTGGGEQGLLGIALHPDWPTDPRGFVHYSGDRGQTVVSELTGRDEGGAPVLDPGSETVLLSVEQPYVNHNGGQLAFGPDGHLWIGLGDGGAGGDPLGNGQDAGTLLGSVLRIDVSEPGAYAIPDGNPFVDGGGAPEVFLSGLRNPWRFSFDPATDRLWLADVGQQAWEEVNRIDPVADAGANLGWNAMEGLHCFADAGCATDGLHLPVTEYGHDAGCSVTGGHVYRGEAVPSLWGWYLFGDYCSGTIFAIPSDAERPDEATAVEPRSLLDTELAISAFGVDAAGELYVADLASGTIYRIVGG